MIRVIKIIRSTQLHCRSFHLLKVSLFYVLVMMKHFLKWIELVPLSNCIIQGATYAFLDMAFNSFGALAKLLIDQAIKLWGVSKVVWEDNDRSSYYFMRPLKLRLKAMLPSLC
jgi:hypothetical protein